jgi:hypothetical protein
MFSVAPSSERLTPEAASGSAEASFKPATASATPLGSAVAGARGSENVTVIGSSMKAFSSPAAGVCDTRRGGVRSTNTWTASLFTL